MPSQELFEAAAGPGGNTRLRVAFIETFTGSGIYNISWEEAGQDATKPGLASAIVAAANRVGGSSSSIAADTAAVPAVQPSIGTSGTTFITNRTSTTTTYTLPAAQTPGLRFTFILGNVGTELLINPIGTDTISIKGSNTAAAPNITTVSPLGIKDTLATHILGDVMSLVSDGVNQWKMVHMSGTWATQ